ncbi:peptidoglycan-binding protein [Candidatus Wolfebacteria bacterium]|nr:peptidoglycan-binding protein [Candidatus Wolfebacteria bacterium]
MSKKVKKVAAIGLSLATAITFAGGVMSASAQTVTIESLLAQIAQLQVLIAQLQAGQSAVSSYNYTRDLTSGSTGNDVKALQQFLNSKGYTVASSGAGSVGNESTYFGSKTAAALAKYQAAVGISPAAGYFGPKTRAYVNSLAAGTTPTTPGTTPVVVPTTGLAITLASDNPAAGSLISGAARVEVLKAAFTAGTSGGVTLNGVKFTKTGVLSDTAINNAYLIEGGKVIAQFASISGGIITFSGLNLGVNAGQTRYFTLGVDPASGLTAGNTVAFKLNAASDITAVDSANAAITPTGAFPFQGNTQTVTSVSNPSIATLTMASSSVGTSVYAGTTNVLVSAWTLTAANSKVNLKSIKYTIVGSAAKGDIQNVKLMVNGTQVGSTLASVASDGTAYFDMTSAPASIQTGSSNLQIYADIMGSPSFNFDFGILNTFDVLATDSTYNSPISVTVTGGGTGSTSGHQITINQGAITVTAASDTPTGNIAKGGSGTTLGKFNIYAAGEAVKVKFIDLTVTKAGGPDWTQAPTELTNISLVDNAGGQVGSTISSVTSGTTSGTCTLTSANVITCHFGVSASPINYIIPANTTRTISAKVDIASTATSTSYTASLPTMTGSNLQGMTSSQSSNSGSASGATLSLASNALTAAQNSGFGNVTYSKGTSNAKIGSYVLTASSAEGVNISNLTITTNASSTNFQNLLVKVGSTQIGSTQSTLTASQAVTFSGAINVPAGGSQIVNVYADILSSATANTMGTVTVLTSCTGTGATTNSSVSCSPTSINGQTLTVASGPSMTVAISSATAPTKQVVMNSAGNSLATFRFTETTNVEPIKINTLIVTATSSNASTRAGFLNAKIYNGSTMIGGPVSASSTGGTAPNVTWAYVFNFTTPPVVPQNGSLELELKGDVASNSSAAASSNATYIFRIASSGDAGNANGITALGQGSNTALTSSTITLSPTNVVSGNTITTLRSKLTLASAALGATSARVRSAIDDLANLSFTADSADPITVNTVSLTFSGFAVSTGTTVSVNLIDPSTGTDWNSGSAASCVSTSNSCTVAFTYTGSNIPTISAGTSKTVKVRVNSASFYNAASAGDGLTVFINTASSSATNGTAINWGDGSTTAGLNLESTIVPVTVFNGSFE